MKTITEGHLAFVCWWRSNPAKHLVVFSTDAESAAKHFASEMKRYLRADDVVATACGGTHEDVQVDMSKL